MQKKVQKLHNLIHILDRKLHEKSIAHVHAEAWANFMAQFKMGRLEAKDIVVGAEVAIANGLNKKANDVLLIAYDLMPTSFIVLEALVQSFRNLSQDTKAEHYLRKHLDKNPDDWNVVRLLGRLFFHTDRKENHVEIVEDYIAQHPQHVAARIELASQKWAANAPDVEQALLDILKIDPEQLYALSQLVQYYAQIPDFTSAEAYLDKIQTLYPEEALRYFCEGFVLEQRMAFQEALANYDKAIEINPHFMEAFGRSGSLMHKLGLDIEEAWYRLEARFPQLLNRPEGPFWRGEELADKHLLLWAEQGLGDQITFASMLRDLPKNISRVDVECDQKLVPLMKRSFPEYHIYPRRTQRPKGHDFHSPIGAIARYLRPSYDSFSKSPPRYLIVDDQSVIKWHDWLSGLGDGLKVGICWRSGTKSVVRSRDAIDLCDNLAPVLQMQDTIFVNLTYRDSDEERQQVKDTLGVSIHQPPELDQFNDLDQTAALIKGLDVVVGIATSPIGLAQGVGCDTVLLYTGDPGKVTPLWWAGTTYLTRKMDEGWGNVVEQLSAYLKNHPDRK